MEEVVTSEYYYTENDRVVFTAAFHLKRGSCCGNFCRHCPFTPKYKKNNKTHFMTFNEYQLLAGTTAIYPREVALMYPTLGLVGEAGEVAEKVKKLLRDAKGEVTPEFKESLKKELGDVLWYLSAICTDLQLTLEDVAQANYNKLQDRQQRNVLHGSGDNR